MPTNTAVPLVYRPNDACRALGIGHTSLYGFIKTGELKTLKLGTRSTGIEAAEIERFIEKRRKVAP